MKNNIKISLLACMLIATVGLFAQEQQNFNISNKYFPTWSNKTLDNNSNYLSKNGYKVRLDSLTYVTWDTLTNSYDNNKRSVQKFIYDSNGNNSLFIASVYFK